MSNPAQVIAIARRDIGVAEEPDGSNSGIRGRRSYRINEMQASTWLRGTHWPWCVAAVQNWFLQSEVPFPYRGAGAYAFLSWARGAGWARNEPEIGYVAIFNTGAGHCALVIDFGLTTVTTVDGNSGNRCRVVQRDRRIVRGYIRHPKLFDKDAPEPPKVKPPIFEVVTSESGHTKVVYAGKKKGVAKHLGALFNKYGGLTVRKRKKKS